MAGVSRQVSLCFSPKAAQICDNLPANLGRLSLVDGLIRAFGIAEKCHQITVSPALAKDLCVFHDEAFVAELLKDRLQDNFEISKTDAHYGLAYDCAPFLELGEYVKTVAGASLSAANYLISKSNDQKNQHVAINWYGGRHHALKRSASGYCYINDIVLAIIRLRTRYKRIFYLDVDLHHGDGVEDAFKFLKNVVTCSIHRHDKGFFPGTGQSSVSGAYNIPTKRGLGDANFKKIIEKKVLPLISSYNPDIIVLQCGSDGLANDPSGEWNLTIKGLVAVLSELVDRFEKTHFLILGGGGYNHTETARFCAWLTKTLVGDTNEWTDIPEHEQLDEYENDGFQFWTPGNKTEKLGRRDENKGISETL